VVGDRAEKLDRHHRHDLDERYPPDRCVVLNNHISLYKELLEAMEKLQVIMGAYGRSTATALETSTTTYSRTGMTH